MRALPMLGVVLALSAGSAGNALANKLDEAQSAFADQRDEDALVLFAEVLADPASQPEALADAHFGRGEILALGNRHEDAVAEFTAALALNQTKGERAMTLYSRAESLSRRNQLEAAIKDYSDSYALSPKQLGVLSARAAAYSRLGRKDEALADYEAELKLHPTYYRALSSRAALLGLPLPPNPEEGRR